MLSKKDFIKGYCEQSKITRELFNAYLVALPCACGDKTCQGWAAVVNKPDSIRWHQEFDAPKENNDSKKKA